MTRTFVIINGHKYTVEGCDFIYKDGTIRLIVRAKNGKKKLAQFSSTGDFEVWSK